eukprot:gene29081-38139_t
MVVRLAASTLTDTWSRDDKELFCRVINNKVEKDKGIVADILRDRFRQWSTNAKHSVIKEKSEEDDISRIIDILSTSTREHRSSSEKEYLKRFISRNLTCIPKSILGDFGNVYYMIAQGTVGLYLESSKDKEMVIAREFGSMRGKPFTGTDEDLKSLGTNIVNLQKGAGFGEIAILATTNKIRMCAAVAVDPNSILLIMHANTYNAVLRQYHYRQKQLTTATNLLSELPLFKSYAYSKLATVAYTMTSQSYSAENTLAKFGEPIKNVMLIVKGEVKVFAAPAQPSQLSKDTNLGKLLMKRLPKLAVSLLGRGQIIGEMEVHSGEHSFQHTYVSAAASTELLQFPLEVLLEHIKEEDGIVSFHKIGEQSRQLEHVRTKRLTRATEVMKGMVVSSDIREVRNKDELLNLLPVILDTQLGLPQENPPVVVYRKQRPSAS